MSKQLSIFSLSDYYQADNNLNLNLNTNNIQKWLQQRKKYFYS